MKAEKKPVSAAFAALSMTWDFVEGNPFSSSTGNFVGQSEYVTRVLEFAVPARAAARVDADTAVSERAVAKSPADRVLADVKPASSHSNVSQLPGRVARS